LLTCSVALVVEEVMQVFAQFPAPVFACVALTYQVFAVLPFVPVEATVHNPFVPVYDAAAWPRLQPVPKSSVQKGVWAFAANAMKSNDAKV
jgi:hypothetical protein